MTQQPKRPKFKALSDKEQAKLAALKASRLGASGNREDFGLDQDQDINKIALDLETYSNNLITDWGTFDLSDIPVLDGLQTAVDTVNAIVPVLKSFVSLVKAAAQVFTTLARSIVNLVTAAYEAAVLLLEAVISAIVGTRGAAFTHTYKSVADKRYTVPAFLSAVSQSYDDKGDENRPVFASASDTNLFVSFIFAVPDPREVATQIAQLKALFSLNSLTDPSVSNFKRTIRSGEYPYGLYENAPSSYPDWSAYALIDFPILRDFASNIVTILDLVRPASTITNGILNTIKLIEDKINQIDQIVQRVIRLLQEIANLSIPRLNMLTIFGPANKEAFQASLLSASNLETYPLRLNGTNLSSDVVAFAFCAHLTLGTGKALDFIKALFKIKDVNEQNKQNNLAVVSAYGAVEAGFDATVETAGQGVSSAFKFSRYNTTE